MLSLALSGWSEAVAPEVPGVAGDRFILSCIMNQAERDQRKVRDVKESGGQQVLDRRERVLKCVRLCFGIAETQLRSSIGEAVRSG